LANQQPAFLNDSHGRGHGSRCCVRRQTGADQSVRRGSERFSEAIGRCAELRRQADVSRVEAAAHALPIFNVFREDAPRDWFTAEQALSNAPRKANGLFIVPKVVE
jgi:aspartyl-tRNA(Asn)/glutamyl-tRNA(Gln) amidotransferase subunit C